MRENFFFFLYLNISKSTQSHDSFKKNKKLKTYKVLCIRGWGGVNHPNVHIRVPYSIILYHVQHFSQFINDM